MNDVMPGKLRRCAVLAAMTMMLWLAGLCMPTSAAAGVFLWKTNANGAWDAPGNWLCNADCGVGFPNRAGDTVRFGALTGGHIITMPNAPVAVGTFDFPNGAFTFVASGPLSSLVLDSGGADEALVTSGANLQQTFSVPITLQSSLRIVGIAETTFKFTRAFSGPGGVTLSSRSIDAGTQAFVIFDLDQGPASSYEGETVVERGTHLQLGSNQVTATPSIPGTLSIGLGGTSVTPGTVVVTQPGQIAATAMITLTPQGELLFVAADQVGAVANSGAIVVSGATVTMASLSLTDGRLDARQGGHLRLLGDLSASGQCTLSGEGGTESVILAASNLHMTVDQASDKLTLSGISVVSEAGRQGLIKNGAGLLVYDGRGTNTYAGLTDVQQGTLQSLRSAITIPADLQIGSNGSVKLDAAGTIAPSSVVMINHGLLITTQDQVVRRIAVADRGQLTVAGGVLSPLGLSLSAANVTVAGTLRLTGELDATSDGQAFSVIAATGAGHISIETLEDLPVITDTPQANAITLLIQAPIQGLPGKGIRKQHDGALTLAGANTYNGLTRIEAGTVFISGSRAASR
jgi:autotransporter-associated beta strand protein